MRRFARFNVVGAIGFGVQLAVLMLLVQAGVPLLLSTVAAVEAALLHNFAWHERWTWRDVVVAPSEGGSRLIRFHLTNGVVSMAGQALLVPALAEAGVALAAASLASVLVCAAANFASAHLVVFCAKTWPTFHGHLH